VDRLKTGDRVGVRFFCGDGTVKFFVNGDECGAVRCPAAFPAKLFPVVELYGSTVSVSIVSSCHQVTILRVLQCYTEG
jgi:hypothetical protein